MDSHVHLDLIERHFPHRIQWLKENECGVVSWSYFSGVQTVSELQTRLEYKVLCVRKHAQAGFPCRYLVGIHPRSIPPDLKPEHIPSLLSPYLADPLCMGIGEIGLETGDAGEQSVFTAQLAMGRDIVTQGKILGVHTPRSNKGAVTEIILNILERFQDLSPALVVDHCTSNTISLVLDAGFWAGVTLSADKTSWEEMKQIISMVSDRMDKVMCNTDSGTRFSEDVVQLHQTEELPQDVRMRLSFLNAAKFYNL